MRYGEGAVSCADVCINHDYDVEDSEFYVERATCARREHRCVECGGTISVQDRYWRGSGKNDGRVWTVKTCSLCYEIRRAFVCGSWIFGELWEAIREEMFPIWNERGPIDCLAKLESREARDKCREEYRVWLEV